MTGYIKLLLAEVAVTAGVLVARWVGEQIAQYLIDGFTVEDDDD